MGEEKSVVCVAPSTGRHEPPHQGAKETPNEASGELEWRHAAERPEEPMQCDCQCARRLGPATPQAGRPCGKPSVRFSVLASGGASERAADLRRRGKRQAGRVACSALTWTLWKGVRVLAVVRPRVRHDDEGHKVLVVKVHLGCMGVVENCQSRGWRAASRAEIGGQT
ncbi:hypothetical protein BJV78DRAFT_1157003 [Lactifluus subvellereus]|nr:hypothetical protein BJV78DRAFT_1157003 [Lactifluus subvellereus]